MRRLLPAVASIALTAVALIGSGAVDVTANAGTAGGSGTAGVAKPPATVRVVVRPVTANGQPAAGFVVKAEHGGQVDCSFRDPSPGAVNANIELCSPSAEYAIACWKAAAPRHVLCTRDPSSNKLAKIPRTGKFAHTKRAPRAQRAPLLLVLGDGTRCSIRDGGAWGTLKSHPRWTGAYSCARHGDVWAPPHSHHNGINESRSAWTVHTANASGKGKVVVRRIKRAYFVGTAKG